LNFRFGLHAGAGPGLRGDIPDKGDAYPIRYMQNRARRCGIEPRRIDNPGKTIMPANILSNRVSVTIPADKMARILAALQVLDEELVPYLVALRPADRRDLPKMKNESAVFVKKTLAYAQSHPQLVPAYVDVEEFERDVAAFDMLAQLHRRLNPSLSLVDDTRLLSGSEALGAALSCYRSIKDAARRGEPAAVTIYKDLRVHFPARNSKSASRTAPSDDPVDQAPDAIERASDAD
jgi:hypothetical protein